MQVIIVKLLWISLFIGMKTNLLRFQLSHIKFLGIVIGLTFREIQCHKPKMVFSPYPNK